MTNPSLSSSAWLPVVIALIAGGSFVYGKKIETSGPPATITVSGEGKVFAVPDIASLSFGVQTDRQKTAQAAMDLLSQTMNKVVAAVEELGVEEKDIQTESLNLHPAFDWNEGIRIPRGFEAHQNLRVKVRDLDKIGAILAAVTAAGANQAGGVNFTIDDPEELRAEAREEAIDNARERAQELAKELGLSLGKLKGFTEGGHGYQPVYMERAMAMDTGGYGGGAPPVPAGEQEIRVSVSLTYEVR